MIYQYLTVDMFLSIGESGIIDQTMFKTQEKYGFDSLVFDKEVVDIVQGYLLCIRKRLSPQCNYLLISRNGKQLTKLSDIFGRMVYVAIGKYINPTRLRQIIETESAERLDHNNQQIISEDQKHTSRVAKVFYKKQKSQEVAVKAKNCMKILYDTANCPPESSIEKNKVTDNNVTDSAVAEATASETTSNEKIHEGKRNPKIPFSRHEDDFIRIGIKKYGKGRWTSILADCDFKFHPRRKAATLSVRAKKLNLI